MKNRLNMMPTIKSDPNNTFAKLVSFERSIKPMSKEEEDELSDIESTSSISRKPERLLSKDKVWSFSREVRRKPQQSNLVVVDLGKYTVVGQTSEGHAEIISPAMGRCLCMNFNSPGEKFTATADALWAHKELGVPLLLKRENGRKK